MLAGVQHIWFQKSPLRECSGNRQKSTFMCHQRDRESTQGGHSVQEPASKKAPAVLGNIGRSWEEERLSGDYCSKICHWCTKGQEKQISNQDIAISNPASRMLKLGLAVP